VIPRWQWAAIILLLLAVAGIGIETAPNSYGYLFLSGRCFGVNVPAVCHTRTRGAASTTGWN
jgi:hypothetical protein